MDWTTVLAAVGGLFAGLAAAYTAFIKGPGAIIRDQRDQLIYEREDRKAACEERDRLLALYEECGAERDRLREHQGRLSRAADLFTDPDALDESLDDSEEGFVIASEAGRGTWIWVNKTFAKWLGVTRAECLALGWRNLIHPAALDRTDDLETSVHDSRVISYVVKFKRSEASGGGWVRLRWNCSRYRRGCALCRVELRGIIPKPNVKESP